jgi:hypothetical protein
VLGQAIDISLSNLLDVYTVSTIKFRARESGFTFIKYYPQDKFLHLDVRET